jgi:hypothetical protein
VDTYFDAYIACVQAPAICKPDSFLASQGTALGFMRASLDQSIQQREYDSADTRGTHWSVQFGNLIDDTRAGVQTCLFDGLVVLGPTAADGQPTVVNDDFATTIYYFVLYRQDGRWLVGDATIVTRLGPEDQCALV